MFGRGQTGRAIVLFIAWLMMAFGLALSVTLCSMPAKAEVASFYGREHHGRKTASGERFSMHAMTAAHKTLPFGTRLRVTGQRGTVVVRINDRGPFIRGRDIDLSAAAARVIGLRGVGRVRVVRVK